jgi:hypothetical protein
MKKPDLERGRAFLLHGSLTMTDAHAGTSVQPARVHGRAKLAEAQANLALGQVKDIVRPEPK